MVTISERQSVSAVRPDTKQIWAWLEEVTDPEIPVISVVDLGIVRDVRWVEAENNAEAELVVTVTPTYSGCPATEVIAKDIRTALLDHGIGKLRLETQLSPPWTTDWLTERGKQNLHSYGIAPPAGSLVQIDSSAPAGGDLAPVPRAEHEEVSCPRCGSKATLLVSRYGSTPCKAHYKCRECQEPFDAFKRH